MSTTLPEQGAAVYALRQIFKKNGFELKGHPLGIRRKKRSSDPMEQS
ncbi:hypothetical protein AB1A81_11245 [Bdellovibrio bacteriovorus]|nr:hypothetical protein [Bdellovibrio bacteriovorus]